MESLLDFSTTPFIFAIRGIFYSFSNVFFGERVSMSIVDMLVTFVFGVCLPSWDTYSDLVLAYTLIRPTCRKFKSYIYHEKYLGWHSIDVTQIYLQSKSIFKTIIYKIILNSSSLNKKKCQLFVYILKLM